MEIKKKWKILAQRLEGYKVGRTSLFDILTKIALFLLMLLAIPALFSTDESFKHSDMKIGSIATKKVVAPYNFYILKTPAELEAERSAIAEAVPFFFNYSDSITTVELNKLDRIIPYLLQNIPIDTSTVRRTQVIAGIRDELELMYDVKLTETNLNIILDILSDKGRLPHLSFVIDEARRYVKKGILELKLSEITRPNVSVFKSGVEESLAPYDRVDVPGILKILENELLEVYNVNQTLMLNYLFGQIIEPNIIYSKVLTQDALEKAIANISRTKDLVYENERIVDANERIDPIIYQKLYSLEVARIERSRNEGNWSDRIAFIAKMMLLAAIILIAGLYLYSFRKKIYANNTKLFLIVIILLIQIILAAIITGPLDWHAYVIPTTISSMLLAILVDSGIAFVGTVVIALVLGGIQGGGYDIALLTLVSGMVSIFAVHRIRTRNQVFKAIVYVAVAYLWVIVALTALRYDALLEAMRIFGFNLLPNAILSPFITFMVLGIFEKLFDITTDVTLLELSDLNHPLLKKLSLEAPGTFHHCMVVGNLSESAAKAINANSLLARVGSYYHDIGKMEKPEYFVENQMDAENRHTQLAPSMSALILANHVKAGVDMAKRNGIPKLIRDFIPEHHGTNIMSYFYNKAMEIAGEKEVNEADFRYPGPKPQSKETGIVMLADAVEAATRTITNPTPNRVRAFVEELVDKRFREGELDECDLTLRDLKNITDAFMPVLFGVFQRRIEYPDQKKNSKPQVKVKKGGKNGNSNSSTTS